MGRIAHEPRRKTRRRRAQAVRGSVHVREAHAGPGGAQAAEVSAEDLGSSPALLAGFTRISNAPPKPGTFAAVCAVPGLLIWWWHNVR